MIQYCWDKGNCMDIAMTWIPFTLVTITAILLGIGVAYYVTQKIDSKLIKDFTNKEKKV